MIDINDLIYTDATIKIEVTPEDLKSFGRQIANEVIKATESREKEKEENPFLTSEQVEKIFQVKRMTIWQWDKKGITKPIYLGKLKRYRRKDILEIKSIK